MLSKRREEERKNAKLFSEALSVCVRACVCALNEWGEQNRRASEIKGMSKRHRWGAERVRKRKHEVQKQRSRAGMMREAARYTGKHGP